MQRKPFTTFILLALTIGLSPNALSYENAEKHHSGGGGDESHAKSEAPGNHNPHPSNAAPVSGGFPGNHNPHPSNAAPVSGGFPGNHNPHPSNAAPVSGGFPGNHNPHTSNVAPVSSGFPGNHNPHTSNVAPVSGGFPGQHGFHTSNVAPVSSGFPGNHNPHTSNVAPVSGGFPGQHGFHTSNVAPVSSGFPGQHGHQVNNAAPNGWGHGNWPNANNAALTSSTPPSNLPSFGNNVRNNFNLAARNWQQNNPAWWSQWNQNWGGGHYSWWSGPGSWATVSGFLGLLSMTAPPLYYNYGQNIVYQGSTVYYNSQPFASASQYYQQAQALATNNLYNNIAYDLMSGDFIKHWHPLGMYSLAQGNNLDTSQLFQLAVSQDGALRGHYYNTITGQKQPIIGNIDKNTMRAAWIIGNNKTIVYDTGMSNLLKPESPILVHFSPYNTQQLTMVRLNQPAM